jgi:hypothetical protein
LVCSLKGYPLRIVTSDAFAEEKLATMRALGAELEVLSSPEGITPQLLPRMIERAAEIVDEVDGFATDQFRNVDMAEGYRSLGDELVAQVEEASTRSAYVGTAGCFTGVTRRLRESFPELRRVAIGRPSPPFSRVASQVRTGSRAAAPAFGRRSSSRTTSTRCARWRLRRLSRWRGAQRGRRACGLGRRRARTSPSPSSSPAGSGQGSGSRRHSSTPGSSTSPVSSTRRPVVVRYRWAVLAAGTTAMASYAGLMVGLPVIAPALREEYSLSLGQVGVLLAAAWVGAR